MAPTRPLVKQQVDACYDIMAIPKKTTAELTGRYMVDDIPKFNKDLKQSIVNRFNSMVDNLISSQIKHLNIAKTHKKTVG